MTPAADHPGDMGIRQTRSGQRSARKLRRRIVGIPTQDEGFGRAHASRQIRAVTDFIPLRESLTRYRRDDEDEVDGEESHEEGSDDSRVRAQANPNDNDRDGRDDDGDGLDEDRDYYYEDEHHRYPSLAAFAADPMKDPTLRLATPARTSKLPTLSTSSLPRTSTSTPGKETMTLSPTPAKSTLPTLTALTGLPTVTGDKLPVANNPQVVTMSVPTTATTTAVLVLPVTTPPTFAASLSPPSPVVQSDMEPSPTVFISDSDQNRGGLQGSGLSPGGEDALISAGSIGAFILICFMSWMGWRMYKRRNGVSNGLDDGYYASPDACLAKIPYFGRKQRAWQDMEADGYGSAMMYESASKSGGMGPIVSIYSTNSQRQIMQPTPRTGPVVLPQLDTDVAFQPMAYKNNNPFSATVSSVSPYSALRSHSPPSPQSVLSQHGLPHSDQSSPTSFSPVRNPFASPEDDFAATQFSPNSAAQSGAEGTMRTFETAATDQSRLEGPFNQLELPPAASAAYNRMSELSSISSGFGDGDIIMPPPAAFQQHSGSRPHSYAKSARGLSRHSSATTRSAVSGNGQRDTVYTATSEDMPARYRSVNSWVSQQTGRVERQQRRDAAEDVPPVPLLPPEQRLTMMMDDGEVPRRHEDTSSSRPPLPPLPN